MANATMLTVAIFGMAPGGYQQAIEDYLAQNGADATADALVYLLGLNGSANYRALADTVTGNLLGSVASAEQTTLISDYLYGELSRGVDAGQLINQLADVLDSISHSDASWGRVAARFDNMHDLAEYYASTAGSSASTDITALRHYVEDVTDESTIFDQIQAEIDDSFGTGSGDDDSRGTAIADDFLALQSLVTLNDNTGMLSTASLRAAIVAETGETAYNNAFDPATYDDGDGTLTASDLGLPQFENLPATVETIESLYFGTTIEALQSIDQTEVLELASYVAAHEAELLSDTLPQEYIDLLISTFSTPGNPPLFTDSMIADAIIAGSVVFIAAVNGGEDLPLFDFSELAGIG